MIYERPKVDGNFTFRSLKTKNQKHAKEELHRRRSGVTKAVKRSTVTVGAVIRKCTEDDDPDQLRQDRLARMRELVAIGTTTSGAKAWSVAKDTGQWIWT